MTRFYFLLIGIFVSMAFVLNAQSGEVYQKIGKEVEACNQIDATLLKNPAYITRIANRFTGNSCADVQSTFVIGTEENRSVVNALSLLCSKTRYKDFKQVLDNISSIEGLPATDFSGFKHKLLSLLPTDGTFKKTHAQCGVCMLGEWIHEYYLAHPDDAPKDDRQFYSDVQQNSDVNPGGGTTTTGGQYAKIGKATMPKEYIWYSAGMVFGLLLLTAFIAAKIAAGKARNSMKIEDVIQNPLLQAHLQQQQQQTQQQIIAAVQNELQRQYQTILTLNKEVDSLKVKNEELAKVAASTSGNSGVDTEKLNQVLTDFLQRITKLESQPQSKMGPDGIRLTPQELTDWIESRPDVKEALKQSLDVATLHNLVVRLLPAPLSLKDLDDLERETLSRYWRLFCQRDEFLPDALGQFRKQLLDELKRNNKIY